MSHPHPELPEPPPLPEGALRVVALGGLGEIGRNMTVLEYAGRLLVVDCGVLFPEESQPGIDLILPDFTSIEDRLDDIEAIVLTHGHEDHIGALPYLLRLRRDIPLLGSRLTLALVEAKLREARIKPVVTVVREGERNRVGPFDLEFLAVNHSIPDALAVAIRTPAGLVLHTGDFKMDQLPLDGRLTDLNGFARLGDEGVDLLLVDSTNAEVPGFVPSEAEITPVLNAVFARSRGRIIVASFASHIHRIQQVIDAGMVPRLIELLTKSQLPTLQFEAAWALTNIVSGSSEHVKACVKEGIVPKMTQLLDSPSDEVRERGYYRVETYTTTSTGARYVATMSQSGDPGYKATSVMLGECGLALALDRDKLPALHGVLTPAAAMGDALLARFPAAGISLDSARLD